jgi:hypothetical protein
MSETASWLGVVVGAVGLRLLLSLADGVAPPSIWFVLTVNTVELAAFVSSVVLFMSYTLRGLARLRSDWHRLVR